MGLYNNILFIDIETVPQQQSLSNLSGEWRQLWQLKAEMLMRYHEDTDAETLYNRAGIYAEFGKIICISCGLIVGAGLEKKLIIKSFYSNDERDLLLQFYDMLQKWSLGSDKYLCAHNGKEFDFPYLCRRLIIQRIKLPSILQIAGKRPWEINHIDTLELWKFGDYKSYTSLNLLAKALEIPTPKDDIDGSKVAEVYWQENNLNRIVTYCQKDVITVAQIYLRLRGEDLINIENIEIK